MSAVQFELKAETRIATTKNVCRRLRHQNKIPVIVYGANQNPLPLTLYHNEVSHALEHDAFYTRIITLNVPGKTPEKTIVKSIQRHAYKPKILHMDFQRIDEHKKLHIRVPLHFMHEADAPGVKLSGGVVSHNLIDIEISCLPKDIPEFIPVDLSKMELGQSIHLADLQLPEGIDIVLLLQGKEQHNLPIVTIQAPRAEEVTPEAAPAAETAEGAAPTAAPGATAPTATAQTTTGTAPAGKTPPTSKGSTKK